MFHLVPYMKHLDSHYPEPSSHEHDRHSCHSVTTTKGSPCAALLLQAVLRHNSLPGRCHLSDTRRVGYNQNIHEIFLNIPIIWACFHISSGSKCFRQPCLKALLQRPESEIFEIFTASQIFITATFRIVHNGKSCPRDSSVIYYILNQRFVILFIYND